jgi:hypothetical protein
MKNVKNVLFVLMFILLASSVCAAASFTVNDLEFGSTSQARNQDVTQTLLVTNNGNESLTINLASAMPTAYLATLSQNVLILAENSSASVIVSIHIPISQATGRLEVTGGIVATSNVTGLSRTARTFVTTETMLEISKLIIEIDGDERTLREDSTYDTDIKAGTPIKVTVYVRNNFNSYEDIDIENIEVDIRSSGDLELDETDDIGDLSYGDKDTVSFTSEIPSDAEDGDDYNIVATVTGRDQNNVLHSDTYRATIEVVRESHEITIKSLSLLPSTVTCNGKAVINVELKNTGVHNEDKVHLLIENNDLDLSQRFYAMSLDEDETIKKSYSFNIDNKTAAGQYDIMVTSFYNTDTESDVQFVTLNVNPCTVVTPVTPPVVINPTNPQPTIPQVVPTNGATPVYGSASFTDGPEYLIILVAVVVVILLVLIILLVKFVF